MIRENPGEIGHNPAMRIIGYCGLCSRAAFLAMLCSLAVAANASAEAPAGPLGEGAEAPIEQGVEGAPVGPTGPGPQAEAEGEVTDESAEGSTGTGGGQETEGTSEGATGGATEGATGGGGEESAESTPPAEEVGAEIPVATSPEETSESAPVVTEQGTREVVTTPLAGSGEEDLTGASAATARASSDTGSSGAATSRPESAGADTQQSTAALAVGLTLPPAGPTADRAEAQASAVSPTATGARRTQAAMTASQRAGDLSCELAALGGSTTDNCAAGWLGGKRFLGANAASFDPGDDSLATTTSGGPPGNDHGGGAAGAAPISPAPGPAPSGASGAAVGGSSGVAPSAFLSLAGLLLLAAPRALRRLRLSCRPWLPACFVLIPERPG